MVPNLEAANQLTVEEKVVENSLPRQWLNYYGYGHITKTCKHPTRCRVRAQNHTMMIM